MPHKAVACGRCVSSLKLLNWADRALLCNDMLSKFLDLFKKGGVPCCCVGQKPYCHDGAIREAR